MSTNIHKFSSNKGAYKKILGLGATFLLGFSWVSTANALDAKTFPGSTCQTSGSQQSMYYSGSKGMVIANRTNKTKSAICPIVRDRTTKPWKRLFVTVRDRHSSQNVKCVAHSTPRTGLGGWAATKATNGEGFSTLSFASIGEADGGSYSVVCQLPSMQKVNQPSYVSSYEIIEP